MATVLEHLKDIETHFEFETQKMLDDGHMKDFEINIAMAAIEHSISEAKKKALRLDLERNRK